MVKRDYVSEDIRRAETTVRLHIRLPTRVAEMLAEMAGSKRNEWISNAISTAYEKKNKPNK